MKSTQTALFFLLFMILSVELSGQDRCLDVFHAKYGGPGRDEGQAVAYASNGDVAVAGNTNSGGAGGMDGFLMRLGPTGNLLWSKFYGNAGDDAFYRLKQTPDNGFIATGSSVAPGHPNGVLWIVKTDASGNMTWDRKLHFGTTDRIKGVDVIPLTTGGYAIAANVKDSAQGDVLISRLDGTGNPLWTLRFDEGHDEGVHTIVQDGGDLLATGYTDGDFRDAFIMRINLATGNVSAARRISVQTGWHEEGASIEVHPGGIHLALKTYLPYGQLDDSNADFSIIMTHLDPQWNTTGASVKAMMSTARGQDRVTYARVRPVPGDGVLVGFFSDYIHRNAGTITWVDRTGRPAVNAGYNMQEGTMMDVDVIDNLGWVGTGRDMGIGDFEVAVTKADRMGMIGPYGCTPYHYSVWNNKDVSVTNEAYNWASVLPTNLTTAAETTIEQTGIFAMVPGNCGQTVCKPLPPAGSGAACTKGLYTQLKDDFQTEMYDGVRMDDGDVMALTYRQYHSVYLFSQLVKIKPDGTVRWAKHIVPEETITTMKFAYRMKKLRDNCVLVFGISSLMKIDQNGNVVWAREIAYQFGGSYGINTAAETENGDLILGMQHGFVRIDGNAGTIIWESRLDLQGYTPFYRGLMYENGQFYVAFEFPRHHPNAFVEVARFDATTGALGWARHYWYPGKELDVFHLQKSGDELTLGVGILSEISLFNYDYRVGAIRMNAANGDLLGGWRLSDKMLVRPESNTFSREEQPIRMDKASGDSLIFAHETYAGRDTSIRIMKFSTDGKLAWIRNYPNLKTRAIASVRADGEGTLITGNFYPRKMIEVAKEGFLLRTGRDGAIEGATAGDCYSEQETGTMEPMTFQEDVPKLVGAALSPEGHFIHAKVYTEPVLAVYGIPSCDVPVACSQIGVAGPDKICDLSAVHTYRATQAAGCTEPVTWTVDPAFADIVSQNAGELQLKFKKVGQVSISASIDGGCKIVSESVSVEIMKTAASATLGADRILCEGNTLELGPGAGFESYRWQDGSSSPTFTATQPGDYSVTVTDKCGNSFTADITLQPAPDYAFTLGPDIRKCPEATVTIDVPQGFNNYTWNTDFKLDVRGTKAMLSPDQDTVYILVAEKDPGCFVRDTVRVGILLPAPISLGADRDLCAGDSLLLQTPPAFTDVTWSTGQHNPSIHVKTAGQYTVAARDQQGCATFDTLVVRSLLALPVPGLPKDGILCQGTHKILQAATGASWQWNTGAQTASITIDQPGKWWVTVTGANGCVAADTVEITAFTANPSNFLPADMEICRQSAFLLQPANNFQSYRWSTGAQTAGITIGQPGLYWLEVTDARGCRGRDEVNILMKDCITAVWFPNAFTPNRDGRHDVFRPVVKGELEFYHLRIFHRWGNLVFESKDPAIGWNGTMQELPATAGAYIWMCEYMLKGEARKVENGSVILMR
ncbi:gliding motility-associated C-terminal domain-containing protein [Chitinophaga caseinilytica]|uniref:T9SS type B sorting domain-containing protein n=1 Tax=Chitinophaga caseinilytica TaxID=2267521 RepID=UPI003C2D460E